MEGEGSLQLGGVSAVSDPNMAEGGAAEAVAERGDLRVVPMLQVAMRTAAARAEAAAEDEEDEDEGRALSRENSGALAAAAALEQAAMQLMQHNAFGMATAFDEGSHTCEVCYEDKLGSGFATRNLPLIYP